MSEEDATQYTLPVELDCEQRIAEGQVFFEATTVAMLLDKLKLARMDIQAAEDLAWKHARQGMEQSIGGWSWISIDDWRRERDG